MKGFVEARESRELRFDSTEKSYLLLRDARNDGFIAGKALQITS